MILTYAFEMILVANDYDVSLTVIQIVICCLGPLFCPKDCYLSFGAFVLP